MRKIIVSLIILAILPGCGSAPTPDIQSTIAIGIMQTLTAEPTLTSTPEPTPDIQATINAGIEATMAAQPTITQILEPSETPVPLPTATDTSTPIESADTYSEFFDKFKSQFEFSKKNMSTPVNAFVNNIYFADDELANTKLTIETTSKVSEITANLMGYTIGVLSALVDEPEDPDDYVPKALPENIDKVHLVFLDDTLQEKGYIIMSWSQFLEYANEKIEFTVMFNDSDWKLP